MQKSSDDMQIEVFVNESYAETYINQTYSNHNSNPVELSVDLPNKKGVQFVDFEVEIQDKKVKSKLLTKEKAEEKYNDAVSSGNAAIYVYEDKYFNRIVINMGNIPPNEKVIFISEFIQLTESSKSYEFELFRNLPIFIGKNLTFQNGNLKGKVEIKTKNKIIKLEKEILMKNLEIIKEENKHEEQIYNYLIEYQILELSKFKENDRNFYYNSDYISSSKIYFYTEENKNNCPFIYCQKSDLFKNEKSYIISYKNNQKSDNLKINPALFIFLIDQSGSMSGSAINIVSKALELFLQSIPVGSYYQLIGFGSEFKKYDESPKSYTKENITNSIKIIKSLKADLGGTDIYQPLKNIYENNNIYNEIKLPKNIFLLTDGEIENKKETLELIEKYSSEFSIFSIGIGNSFDKDLIKNSGIIGKGGFNFCPNLEGLNSIIINEIDKCVSSYISNFNMKTSLDEKHLYKTFNIPEIVRNNQIINLGYIIEDDSNKNDNKIKIDLEYFEDGNKKKNYEINPEIIKDGNELSKLIINNYLDNDLSEKEKEKLALKYQLLTKYTSLFAEIELSDKISDEMKTKIIGENNYYNINNRNDEIKIKKDEILENIDYCYDLKECYCYMKVESSCRKVDYSQKCKKKNSFNIFSSIFLCCKKKRKIEYKNDEEKVSNEEIKNTEKKIINKFENDIESDYINSNIKINDNEINSNNNNKLSKNELMKIINTQDFIEGFWEYNDNTKFLKEKYEKEYEILKKDKNINCNEKIILTILMIYYIEKNYSELLNELSFVIKKGKIFINKETKSNYEELIKLI